jgi:[ribosomal protein S5]-alanine N-acetyltransferase
LERRLEPLVQLAELASRGATDLEDQAVTGETVTVGKQLDLPTIARFGVTLRPWQLTDAPALREACGDQRIMRFTTVPGVFTEAAAIDWINRARQRAEDGTAMVLAIVEAGERFPIGMVGLFGLDRADDSARLGYWLVDHARGRGIATAAARSLTDWAFARLGLSHVVIDREASNIGSAGVAQKLGAIETGAHLVEYQGAEVELIRYVVPGPRA